MKIYKTTSEYYLDCLDWIDLYLYKYLESYTNKMQTSGKKHVKNSRAITRDEVAYTLGNDKFNLDEYTEMSVSDIDTTIENIVVRYKESVRVLGDDMPFIPLEYLKSVFHLTKFETFVILLSFSVEFDRKYEKIYGYFNDYASMTYPTIQSACLIYDSTPNEYMKNLTLFHEDGKLMKFFFIDEDNSRSSMQLRLTKPIVNFLMDADLNAIVLPESINLFLPDEPVQLMPEFLNRHHDIFTKMDTYLKNAIVQKDRRMIMNLHGPTGIGRLNQIKQYCKTNQHSAVIINLERLNKIYESGISAFRSYLRELAQTVLLHQSVLVVTHGEVEDHRDLIELFINEFLMEQAPFVQVTFFLTDNPLPSLIRPEDDLTLLHIDFPHLHGTERATLYKETMQNVNKPFTVDIEAIASKFEFTTEQVKNAVYDAYEISRLEMTSDINSQIFHKACRNQLSHNLDKKAQRIDGGGNWDKLILPDSSKDLLREVCAQVKYKSLVLDDWGFQEHLTYGTGLALLLSGPPGTGKTFSAKILANELDLELYKVDLSQMISKYIGETEKNIKELFDQAKGSSAILLFDEGDALFGKRTETQDAHDKYANVETAFLLQKIEAYKGICILTTNLMQNIDPAFIRRFRFVVHFPIPDKSSRLKIWKGIYPKAAPLSKHIDFEFLAGNFELTGGHIKNIALSSSFKAAAAGQKIDMAHIMLSIQHELGKTGKTVLRSDFGEYAYMLDE